MELLNKCYFNVLIFIPVFIGLEWLSDIAIHRLTTIPRGRLVSVTLLNMAVGNRRPEEYNPIMDMVNRHGTPTRPFIGVLAFVNRIVILYIIISITLMLKEAL